MLKTLLVCGIIFPATEAVQDQAQGYSTNAICAQFNCINPIVPGLSDLALLQSTAWQCQDEAQVKKYMSFCKDAIYYQPGVPSPKNKSTTLEKAVTSQDNAAATMYFYALNGMNIEPWQHRQPWLGDNSCLLSVWKTVCSTYFPRAEAGCKNGEGTKYLRPCKNVCENYLKACSVQCCDESVQCVFQKKHAKNSKLALLEGDSAIEAGYYNENGPSAMCTGPGPSALEMCLQLGSHEPAGNKKSFTQRLLMQYSSSCKCLISQPELERRSPQTLIKEFVLTSRSPSACSSAR